jgi:hypothetical protein
MIVTKAEVKTFLNLGTDTQNDDRIDAFIPYVEEDIIDYCNNAFQDGYVYTKGFIECFEGAPDYLEDRNGYFLKAGFDYGMDIYIEGGYSNVGLYRIATDTNGDTGSVSDTRLKLQSTGELITQDRDSEINVIGEIKVSRVKWPKALKPVAAQMVWHMIYILKPDNVKSESIDDYSVTYVGSHKYPESVAAGLEKYKNVRFL